MSDIKTDFSKKDIVDKPELISFALEDGSIVYLANGASYNKNEHPDLHKTMRDYIARLGDFHSWKY